MVSKPLVYFEGMPNSSNGQADATQCDEVMCAVQGVAEDRGPPLSALYVAHGCLFSSEYSH